VFQISLSLLLLMGAALFLRSQQNLLAIDPGFARENVLMASIEADGRTLDTLMERVKQLPGVTAAGFADSSPLKFNTGWNVYVRGLLLSQAIQPIRPWLDLFRTAISLR
jgi:hypothetical protein